SEIYVRMKREACEEVGIRSVHHEPEAAIHEGELLELVRELGADDGVDGILVQLPVPAQISDDALVAAIDPQKDVDGLTPWSAGGEAGRGGDRRRRQPARGRTGGRRRLRRRLRAGGRDHPGSRRRRPDDDRDAPRQYAEGGPRPPIRRIGSLPDSRHQTGKWP